MSGKRRNPALSGVSGIMAEDLAALDAKRVTIQDLADKLGCSKQAISRKIRAMRSTGPSVPITPTTSPPGPSIPSIPAGAVLIDPAEIATSACLGLLHRAHAALASPDQIGPSGLKALATTVSTATAELRLLGFLDTGNDDSDLSVLTVRVMTDEEHAETKRRVELPDDYEN